MVGFGDAIRLGFARFGELGGRSTRAEFWWWWLAFAVIVTVLEGTPLAFLAGLVLVVPSITLLVRRLHDTGRAGTSAWVLLIPGVGVLILMYFLAQPGDPASNRYGPPPVHDLGAPGRPWADPGPGDRPRASGWDDLPPPAPHGGR